LEVGIMFLLQMAGYPGSGKSTLSKRIAKQMNAVVIDRDIIKTSMIHSGVSDNIVADASYKVVFDLAEYYLSMRISVIIDTPCYYEGTLKNGMRIADKYKANYKYIECKVDEFTIIENRLKTRERLISQIKTTTIERFTNALGMSVKPDGNFLNVNTSSNGSYDMKEIQKYLERLRS
jgi:predicted kinase